MSSQPAAAPAGGWLELAGDRGSAISTRPWNGRPESDHPVSNVRMLQARGLSKRYGGVLALDRVDFDVAPGEIVGYLGPNGSGKSTTVNLVVGLLEPTAGSIALDGLSLEDEPVEYKQRIGYVPEEPFLYTHLTAGEYLTLIGRLRGMAPDLLEHRINDLLTLLQLFDNRYKTMRAFSKGMRQRVLLAAALMHNPRLLVLDEPFSGLDVNAGLLFRTLLTMLADEGRMVLFSTHRFDMVERLCSRVVMLSNGRVVASRTVESFGTGAGESLEDVFMRATDQPDYAPVARRILDTIAAT
jgi:ABC-2 type transport system ATP-binding protein